MIRKAKLTEYTIPCKNKFDNEIYNFTISTYTYDEAIRELEFYLHPIKWIIGYGSM